MAQRISVTIHQLQFELLGRGGVYWPAEQTLFVADPHLGKETTFRRHGIPVPRGSTTGTLQTVSQMLIDTAATRLVILGDMFHARSSLSQAVVHAITKFIDRHGEVEFLLVRGNHDSRIGALPQRWPLSEVPAGALLGEVAIGHHPREIADPTSLWMCGHLHPAVRFATAMDSVGKLPCFWVSKGNFVLPAVGQFTGTYCIDPKRGDQVWLIAQNEVLPHPRFQ